MKNLSYYINQVANTSPEAEMKHPRVMAEQNDGHEEPYNSTRDRWSRRAKHPMQLSDKSDMQWAKGDLAIYEGMTVEISVPRGPNGTVGILTEGHTKMVSENMLERLDEGVMGGMMPLGPINRIMQLAGLSQPTVAMPSDETTPVTENAEVIEEADATNMFNALFKANMTGEFRNNPDAARLATVGQVMVGLESQIAELRDEVEPGLLSKLNVAVALGADLLRTARTMLKPQAE